MAKAAQRAWPTLTAFARVNLESAPEEGDADEGEEGRPAGPPTVGESVEGESEELSADPEDAQLVGELSAAFERSDLEA